MPRSPRTPRPTQSQEQYAQIEHDSRLGPFIFRGRIGRQWHVVTPTHITRKQIQERVTPEQYQMLRKANVQIYNLRQRIYDLRMRGYLPQSTYERVRDFLRTFMLTPRKEGDVVVYRLPTIAELHRVFPSLAEAEIRRSIEGKKIQDDVRRRGRPKG